MASHRTLYFFSSRRRHTRSKRDWSSDVCSSDLADRALRDRAACRRIEGGKNVLTLDVEAVHVIEHAVIGFCDNGHRPEEIGRASCRERGEIAGGGVAGKRRNKTREAVVRGTSTR